MKAEVVSYLNSSRNSTQIIYFVQTEKFRIYTAPTLTANTVEMPPLEAVYPAQIF